jgi:hypothetical protein
MNKSSTNTIERFRVGEGRDFCERKKVITQFKGKLIAKRRK